MQKKHLTFWEMFNLNFGFLGIQFGWGLQMANMSGIYKFLGATSSQIGYLWVFAPLTGMLIQPILGQMSDRTWIRYLGRRRPYILLGAFLSTFALIFLPHSASLWMAASLLFVLDSSVNIAMQPYRALVADVAPEEQHSKTYAVQTFLVGIGATLASALPWILLHVFHLSSTPAAGEIPLDIRVAFYIGAVVFLVANIWTVFASDEYPPEDMDAWKASKKEHPVTNPFVFVWQILRDLAHMPKLMLEISFVQFFTWIGWFCLFLYYCLAIAQNVYGLPPGVNVSADPLYSRMLEEGVTMCGLCFSAYTLVSFIYALLIPRLNKLLTRKGAHMFSLTMGGLGMLGTYFIHTPWMLFVAMIGIGMAWASTVTLPFAMLASSLPEDKMGVYMGLFNITVCLPEIIASILLGYLALHVFHSHAIYVIAMGGVFFIIGAFCTIFVKDKQIKEETF